MMLPLTACHHTAYPVAPSIPPVESGINLQLDTQTRSLEEAYRAYVQGRYSKASILFKRFIEANPQSPRLSEARWWLARSYEAQGNVPGAIAEYRTLAGASSPPNDSASGYQAHAVRRLDALMQNGGTAVLSEMRSVVLSVSYVDWSRIADLSSWIAKVRKAGVTTLLIDAGTSMADLDRSPATGVYFKTSVVPLIDDLLGRVIPLAHAEGVAVFARLDLHQAAWMSPNPEWVNAVRGQSALLSQSSSLVDVLNPEYQQTVSRIVDDLCRTGIDGLVLQARMRKGFAEEISPTSWAVFERQFGSSTKGEPTSPSFWRWAGWKTRSYLRFVGQLRDQVRRERSTRSMVMTIHASAVLDPKASLIDYGEDLLETRLRGFEALVLLESEASTGGGISRTELVKRLAQTTTGERPLWLGLALTRSDPDMIPEAVTTTLTAMSEQPHTPLVLMNGAVVP